MNGTTLIFVFCLILAGVAQGKELITVKVAILENLQTQKLSSEQYEKDYFTGIEVAKEDAHQKGINYIVKYFKYGTETTEFFDEVKKLKDWNPDLIIGPRTSGKFLLLKDEIKDTVVFSPLATASAVSQMPSNFYSLTFPNEYTGEAIGSTAKKLFPGKNIFELIEVDCKNCVDAAKTFETKYGSMDPTIKFKKASYLNDQAEKIELGPLLREYKPGDIFLMANTSYTSGVMIARISDYLEKDGVTFLGNDEWGSWKAGYVGKLGSKFKYRAIRVEPWSLDVKNNFLARCQSAYSKKNDGKPLPDLISFISCHTLNMATDLLVGKNQGAGPKETLMAALKSKLKRDPNWFRPRSYAVHELTQNGEKFITTINVKGL